MTITFGPSTAYDSGLQPVLAINDAGTVVEVHKSQWSDTLYYHAGAADPAAFTLTLTASVELIGGTSPGVALDNAGTVVVVYESGRQLYSLVGVVDLSSGDPTRYTIAWGETQNYDGGLTPAVAMTRNGSGVVVAVHVTNNVFSNALYYHVGQVDVASKSITWGPSVKYDTGAAPHIALSDAGAVVEVHRSQAADTIWYHAGAVDVSAQTLSPLGGSIEVVAGAPPSVALDDSGNAIEVHQTSNLVTATTYYDMGTLGSDGVSVTWQDSVAYDAGVVPAIAVNNQFTAVEVHQTSNAVTNTLYYLVGVYSTQVVPLQADMSNIAVFVNSLFSPAVRNSTQNGLSTAIAAGALYFPYADATSRGLILGAWLAAWQAHVGAAFDATANARCPAPDRTFIAFIADYLQTNQLLYWRPALTFDGFTTVDDTSFARYANAGYAAMPFVSDGAWQFGGFDDTGAIVTGDGPPTVAQFLFDLFYGAHMVAVSSSQDVDGGSTVAPLDLAAGGLPTHVDLVNSHYTQGLNSIASGDYYAPASAPMPSLGALDIETLSPTLTDLPLLLALLVGTTAKTTPNQFLQLEGWPSQVTLFPAGGARHGADFAANQSTLWNFSTFGACVYSEKRSTTLFLANADFDATLSSVTGMPLYWGAEADNVDDGWMHPSLIVSTGR